MKYKLKSNVISILVVGALVLAIIFAIFASFYMKNLSNDLDMNVNGTVKTNIKREKSLKIKEYVKSIGDNLIEEVDFGNDVTSILYIENDKYQSKIFNYVTGEELSVNSILKKGTNDEFFQKVNELLYLKYPTFIADVLKSDNLEKVYSFKETELVIYYYNYVIDPMPKDMLYLKVNYNEIKDYLNMPVGLDKEYVNEDGSLIDSNKKLIALTFDDGPGPYTISAVNILKSNKAKATFFMLGSNLNRYENAVLEVCNSGFEIGYHSYAHKNFKRQELDEIKREFDMSNEILKGITGKTFDLVRPPYGSINEEIKEVLNTPIILWHVDTEDWRYKDSEYLTNYVLNNVQAGDIILFHDIHKTSVETMNRLLPELYVNGFQVVTVSELAQAYDTKLEAHKAYRYFTK